MDEQKMIQIANRIAAYFEAYPEGRARKGVADHIRKFWPPSMRTELVAYAHGGGEGLHPLVLWAVEQLPEAVSLASAESS